MTAATRPLPVVDDRDTGGFFEAALRDELVVRVCRACDAAVHLPRQRCGACGSDDTAWEKVSGTGHVVSWTVVEHQVHPAFPTPYTVVLVALDDRPQVRLVGQLPGRPELCSGTPLRVRFDLLDDTTAVPGWDLVEEPQE
jgi:uncharacterized OB-fold protein